MINDVSILKYANPLCLMNSFFLLQFITNLSNLRPFQLNADGTASFEIDMDLIDQSSSIFMYKVSV